MAVIAGASGSWDHFTDQARQDWYYLVLIVGGFRTQIALMSGLRRRRRRGCLDGRHGRLLRAPHR